MRQHKNARLTIAQRVEMKRLYEQEQVPVRKLMQLYQASENTIRKWVKRESPYDLSSTPHKLPSVVSEPYRQAVIAYRNNYPRQGPVRIAHELRHKYPFANRGTVLQILQKASMPAAKREKKQANHLPVGRHRVQMDIQQLPCIEGDSGFEYKISMIHLATRFKYWEIHQESTTETIADVFRRGLDALPPFLACGQTMP